MTSQTTERARYWWTSLAATALVLFVSIGDTLVHAQIGPIGQKQQPLVAGNLVSIETQKDFGLVTVTGNLSGTMWTCSGTLLNRSWVLTADHCLASDRQIKGPAAPLSSLAVSAAWTTRTAVPTMMIRLWGDVALLFLGHGDLGAANVQLLYHDTVDTTQTITKFGRGIHEFAAFGTDLSPIPAQSDGLYRSGVFNPTSADDEFITVLPNESGQIANGGDSGGPDFVTAPDGTLLGVAGVQSTCVASGYLSSFFPWLPQTWTWATGVESCSSAGIIGSRSTILNIVANRPIASNDFNDDNLPDIVWHNSESGETQMWFMDRWSRIGRETVVDEGSDPILVGLPWHIVASRDFNRNDRTDLLWHNDDTGELQIWYMREHQITGRVPIIQENGSLAAVGAPWRVAGANDMDGNGYADIIWHNEASGETQIWMMNGRRIWWRATVHAENGAPMMVGWPWNIVATDDMNGDRKPDILWHNDATGETQIWYMNGWRITGRQTVRWENYYAGAALVGWPWRITSTNDFDHDRIADIVWHNAWSGETQIWFMNVGAIKSRATVVAPNDGGDALVLEPWRIMRH